jgi:hypothetical protein
VRPRKPSPFPHLCAVREGARGVDAINRLVSKHFRSTLKHPLDPGEHSEWYPGRPVMVLRNDYVLKLFNGDIGIVMPDDSGDADGVLPGGRCGIPRRSPGSPARARNRFCHDGAQVAGVRVRPGTCPPSRGSQSGADSRTGLYRRDPRTLACDAGQRRRRVGKGHTDADPPPVRAARAIRRIAGSPSLSGTDSPFPPATRSSFRADISNRSLILPAKSEPRC